MFILANVVEPAASEPLTVPWPVFTALGYLCGSISFAWIIGKFHGVDIAREGSRNLGATNVGRVLGKKWGYLCFFLDFLKGLLPVLLAGWMMGWLGDDSLGLRKSWYWLSVAIAAIIGHMFPVWLGFRGGKGVATSLGALMGIWPLVTLPAACVFVIWLLLVAATRYISVASIGAALALPPILWAYAWYRDVPVRSYASFLLVSAILALLILLRHRGNLKRLRQGTEPKIGEPRPTNR